MRRQVLSIAQFVLAMAMLPAAILFGALGFIPAVLDILTHRFSSDFTTRGNYFLASTATSFFIIAAFLLCIVSATLLLRRPSALGIRLSIAGATCYWLYVFSHFAMYWTTSNKRPLWHVFAETIQDRSDLFHYAAWDYPVAVFYALIAFGLHSSGRRQRLTSADSL